MNALPVSKGLQHDGTDPQGGRRAKWHTRYQ